jgi:hypothetical protein
MVLKRTLQPKKRTRRNQREDKGVSPKDVQTLELDPLQCLSTKGQHLLFSEKDSPNEPRCDHLVVETQSETVGRFVVRK